MKKTRLNLPALILLAGLAFGGGCKDGTTVDNTGPVNTCDGRCVQGVQVQRSELGSKCNKMYPDSKLFGTEFMATTLGAHDDAMWASWRKRNGFTHYDPGRWKAMVSAAFGRNTKEFPCTNNGDLEAAKAAFYKKATELTGIKYNYMITEVEK